MVEPFSSILDVDLSQTLKKKERKRKLASVPSPSEYAPAANPCA